MQTLAHVVELSGTLFWQLLKDITLLTYVSFSIQITVHISLHHSTLKISNNFYKKNNLFFSRNRSGNDYVKNQFTAFWNICLTRSVIHKREEQFTNRLKHTNVIKNHDPSSLEHSVENKYRKRIIYVAV